jgi:peptidoglycan-N-acetylglucosamine deacetylase
MINRFNFRVHLPEWFTRLYPGAVWRMPLDEKVVYLTFDDGPVPDVTPEVLDILDKWDIKATFFCVGDNVDKYPELFHDILMRGHTVGNHTYNHLNGMKNSFRYYMENVEKADRCIGSNLFRPPYGVLRKSQYLALKQSYKIVMWDVISCDYDPLLTPQQCYHNVMDFVRNGSIITFHDSRKAKKNLLGSLSLIIETLVSEGYSFRKIEFAKTRPNSSEKWARNMQKIRETFQKKKNRA